MSSLINMRMLEINESVEPVINDTESKQVETEIPVDNLSQDADNGTPNTKIDSTELQRTDSDQLQNKACNFEELEDKINRDYNNITDSITEGFYEIQRDLMISSSLLESISIDTIRKQKNILTESALNSPKYYDDINVLIESTGQNILNTIIEAIKRFIRKAKELLRDLGINISLSFVDYAKWADSKSEDLKSKANKVGHQVEVKVYKWDKSLLFSGINFTSIHNLAEKYVKSTTDKDTMKEIESEIASKYDNIAEMKNDIYCHALAIASNGNPDDRKFTDKTLARSAFMSKFKYDERTKYMDLDRTNKCLKDLKNMKSETNSCISSMRNTFINPDFERLLRDTEREARSREDKNESRKYKYYRLRFEVLSSLQDACDDIYRIKISLMKEYARECYNSLKALDGFTNNSTNESIDMINDNIIGNTLHA